jgi:hypothetical protein
MVLDTGNGQNMIPVPLSMFQFNSGSFALNADAAMLQAAPSLANGQIPDTTMSGWDSQFSSFWQGVTPGSGTGTGGAQATATP